MSTPIPGHSGSSNEQIAFIGGGNMASAIMGGLLKRGMSTSQIQVVEPWDEQRDKLHRQFPGVQVHENPGEALASTT
ncbi:MAG: NAD(P)-binding domain-containing protein, partial [Polaromonas sp.]|nr:NAD(P)-binding domain-containing protein [Polaromonas sp.]